MFKKIYFALIVFMIPVLSFAQQVSGQLNKTRTLLGSADSIVRTILIPLAFTLALLFFFWGVAKYIRSESTAKAEGKQIMVWGVVALAVMSMIWGLVFFIGSEFGVAGDYNVQVPTINGPSGGSFDTGLMN